MPDNDDDSNDEDDEEEACQEPRFGPPGALYGEDVYVTFRKRRGLFGPILVNSGWNNNFTP